MEKDTADIHCDPEAEKFKIISICICGEFLEIPYANYLKEGGFGCKSCQVTYKLVPIATDPRLNELCLLE